MAEVKLTINGRSYTVACDDGQEAHLRHLAGHIDQRVGDNYFVAVIFKYPDDFQRRAVPGIIGIRLVGNPQGNNPGIIDIFYVPADFRGDLLGNLIINQPGGMDQS